MKVAIMTQPLHDNYGGLLQAYALKEVLKGLGHEIVIVNRQKIVSPKKWRIFASKIKHRLKGKDFSQTQMLTEFQKSIISEKTIGFTEKYIPELSNLIVTNEDMMLLNKDGFDAFVVGSDQCWRPIYSPEITNYFLDFAVNNKHVKRIAYAASFGTSEWEFSKPQTKKCKKLLKNFDAISVRESSGVNLVRKYLDRKDALHVLDPTMLLAREHYQKISEREHTLKSSGNLKVYVLDKSKEKTNFINLLEERLGLKKFEVMPKKRTQNNIVTDGNAEDFQYPSPAIWLRGFSDANFVITDSFHGTLFSILFNIPFITIGNKTRGMARFESLLSMFNLSDRLIVDISKADLDKILSADIDWKVVNQKIEHRKIKSLNFIITSLE